MPVASKERFAVARWADDVSLDSIEDSIGKHELAGVHIGPFKEDHAPIAATVGFDRDHLAAEHIEIVHKCSQIDQEPGGEPIHRRHRLDR
jgi:hypothetical protein